MYFPILQILYLIKKMKQSSIDSSFGVSAPEYQFVQRNISENGVSKLKYRIFLGSIHYQADPVWPDTSLPFTDPLGPINTTADVRLIAELTRKKWCGNISFVKLCIEWNLLCFQV